MSLSVVKVSEQSTAGQLDKSRSNCLLMRKTPQNREAHARQQVGPDRERSDRGALA